MRVTSLFIAFIFSSSLSLFSQNVGYTNADERLSGFEKRQSATGNHMLTNLKFKNVGPTIMGGRVTDIEVSPSDVNKFYIAYASGGLWLTENNGQTYQALFDREMVISIGDIAVNWEKGMIWVGTGENNSSRSSYSGFGIYLSVDGGKTWTHKGLPESHHIGRILLHPTDPKTLWVAVLGHLYTGNADRGIYKTADGGLSWKKVLFVDDSTGAIDVVLDPKNPNKLYASFWHRDRKPWNFVESGTTSGIYKSVDGGENWQKVSGGESGFPQHEGVGRIGLAASSDADGVVYALLDNQARRPPETKVTKGLDKRKLKEFSKDDFLKLPKTEVKEWLESNNFPKIYTVDTVFKMVQNNTIQPSTLVDYIEDANSNLFETEVIGAEVYASMDEGKSWVKKHPTYLDDFIYSYGYYFGQIRVDPSDPKTIYITGVPLLKSNNGGESFISVNGDNQHVDHHAIWINPNNSKHIINGNDGGLNISYDAGANWLKVNSPPVGQFYTVNVDMAKPYQIYGGLQDNGVWVGPSEYEQGVSWQYLGKYPYRHLLGGDGFKVEIDTRDQTVYTGYQFGHYFRVDNDKGKRTKVTPRHNLGEKPFRFNWQTPIHLSRHNQDIFYFGSNKFHRSLNKGNDYDFISNDLTKGIRKGDVAFGTLTYIHESPLRFGLIYVGTDDGNVHRSEDIGYHWQTLNNGLPKNLWVTCVQASSHDTATVYLALNGYRHDDFNAYVYSSSDKGQNWSRIGLNLPLEPVNTIKEDPENSNILYVGTDHGLYISMNKGKDFLYMNNELPAVPVHDLVIHPREHDLVVATHGRSLYKADVSHVQGLTEEVLSKKIHLFKIDPMNYDPNLGKKGNMWKERDSVFVNIVVYAATDGAYTLKVNSEDEVNIYTKTHHLTKGLNYLKYDLTIQEQNLKGFKNSDKKSKETGVNLEPSDDGNYYLIPGKYNVVCIDIKGEAKASQKFELKKKE